MDTSTRLKLMKQLQSSDQFVHLTSNVARADFYLRKGLNYELTRKVIQDNLKKVLLRTKKSRHTAECYLREYQLHLKDGQLDASMEAIHSAIRYVPIQDVNLRWKLYALKGELHSHRKEYREALYSAQMAATVGGDGQLDLDLVWLQLSCLLTLRRFGTAIQLIEQVLEKAETFSQYKGFPNAAFEGIKTQLEKDGNTGNYSRDYSAERAKHRRHFTHRMDVRCKIERSPLVGRYLLAKEDIPKKTILLREMPYSLWLEPEYLLSKCTFCYRDLKYRIFPCEHCTEVLFCDEKCFQSGWHTYHRFECGLVSQLHRLTSPVAHVYRILSRIGPLKAIELEKDTDDDLLEKYIADLKQRDVPEREKTRMEKEQAYQVAASLVHHNEKHSQTVNAYHTVLAIETATLLELVHDLRSIRCDRRLLCRFVSLITTGIRRIIFNVFGWNQVDDKLMTQGHVANCLSLLGSLVNHSCVPNTTWQLTDGVLSIVSKVAIGAGTEINISYGPNESTPYAQRQERLNQYFFGCNCRLCQLDTRKAENLRCRQCNGPVPFHSELNKVHHLSGKCLHCFHQYAQFQETIDKLLSTKESLQISSQFTMTQGNEHLLQQTVNLLRMLLDLSLPESTSNCRSVLTASRTMEKCAQSLEIVSPPQRLELVVLLDAALPLRIPKDCFNGKSVHSLKFWFESLPECLVGIEDAATMDRLYGVSLRFHQRLYSAAHCLLGDKHYDQKMKEAFEQLLNQIDQVLDRCKKTFQLKV